MNLGRSGDGLLIQECPFRNVGDGHDGRDGSGYRSMKLDISMGMIEVPMSQRLYGCAYKLSLVGCVELERCDVFEQETLKRKWSGVGLARPLGQGIESNHDVGTVFFGQARWRWK